MPGIDLELDPIGELVLQDSGAHIDNPLLRSLGKFELRFREV